jgi:antitoxin HicB
MKRHLNVGNTRTFAVVLEPEPEGGFTVRVPSLPEIVTYGADEREALAMAEDAIRLVLEDSASRAATQSRPAILRAFAKLPSPLPHELATSSAAPCAQ